VAFNLFGLVLPLAGALLALAVSTFVWFSIETVLEQVERLRTRRTLERYVSKNVAAEMLDNPEDWLASLGGKRQQVAVMFTDLRGFTTLTERGDSHQLVEQLNEYFGAMVTIVFRHGGTLDKFIGDAIMAVWGNIRSDGDAADARACLAAGLEMQAVLGELNARWRERGWVELAMGMGINVGEAVVGNMGCQEKMEFTVIGDPVNLASRLEGATKEYGVDVLLGERAAELVSGAYPLVPVDRLQVKGKTRAAEVFTVYGPGAGPGEGALAAYRSGVEAYRAGRFEEAVRLFGEASAAAPSWKLPKLYVDRSTALAADPPPEWNGVFVMTKK
jgi:adenylate cyclase